MSASRNTDTWAGLNPDARARLETRDYSSADLALRLGTTGVNASEAIAGKDSLSTASTCASWAVQCVSPTHRVCSAIGWWFRPSNVIPQARR